MRQRCGRKRSGIWDVWIIVRVIVEGAWSDGDRDRVSLDDAGDSHQGLG